MKRTYGATVRACCIGYIVQAAVVNLPPLLFIIYKDFFGVSYTQLGTLVMISFVTQIIVDLLTSKISARIGLKNTVLASHYFAATGFFLMGIVPFILPESLVYYGIAFATVICSVGSGIIEVIITPLTVACPVKNKDTVVSVLHSFYCWGQMLVILLSTLFLLFTGKEHWYILPFFWGAVPLLNSVNFLSTPIPEIDKIGEKQPTAKKRLFSRSFVLIMLIIIFAGASELAMAQWASMFAERGLGVSKAVGDLLGPCLFAIFMGLGRVSYAFLGKYISLKFSVIAMSVLCIGCYLTAAFNSGIVSLIACALTGFAISMMWPTALIFAERMHPDGGTRMYGILATGGDIGCSVGPWLVGFISDAIQEGSLPAVITAETPEISGLRSGICVSAVFPLIVLVALAFCPNSRRIVKHEKKTS